MEVMEAIKGRRAVRRYKEEPISEDDIKFVLDAARYAPSWANTQCWEFIVVKNPGTKEKLQETLTPKNPAREAVVKAPCIIVALGRKGISGHYKGAPVTDKGDWLMFDVALAIHNITLSAYSRGLGTIHIGAFDAKKAAEILKVPDNAEVVELIPIGYPDESPLMPRRKELKEFVFSEEYGKPYP